MEFQWEKALAVLAAIGGVLADARLVMALRDRAASVAAPAGALALAAPTAAQASRLASKLYMPTALLHTHLPAGMVDLQTVPRFARQDETRSQEECLAAYVAAIRATAQVFATSNHKTETLVSYDGYMVWVDAWLVISGFGSYVVVDPEVRAWRPAHTLRASRCCRS